VIYLITDAEADVLSNPQNSSLTFASGTAIELEYDFKVESKTKYWYESLEL
jgi:hypothetical protein